MILVLALLDTGFGGTGCNRVLRTNCADPVTA